MSTESFDDATSSTPDGAAAGGVVVSKGKQRKPRWILADALRDADCQSSAPARQVGVALAVYWMNDTGTCNPSVTTIGEATDLARRTVFKALSELVRDGYIVSRRTGYGPKHSNEYRVGPKVLEMVHEMHDAQGALSNGARDGARDSARDGAPGAHEQVEQREQIEQIEPELFSSLVSVSPNGNGHTAGPPEEDAPFHPATWCKSCGDAPAEPGLRGMCSACSAKYARRW